MLNFENLSAEDLDNLSIEQLETLQSVGEIEPEDSSVKAFLYGAARGVTGVGQAIGETLGLEDPQANKEFFNQADLELEARFGQNNSSALSIGRGAGTLAGVAAAGGPLTGSAVRGGAAGAKAAGNLAKQSISRASAIAKSLLGSAAKPRIRGSNEEITKQLFQREALHRSAQEGAAKAAKKAAKLTGLF